MTTNSGPTNPAPRQSRRWILYRRIVLATLVVLFALNTWGMFVYLRETRELVQIAERATLGAESKTEEMRRLAAYCADEIPRGHPDDSFLLPIFSPLRPTAWQVVQHGGDCSFKARTFIVLANHRGIPATRWALYQPNGVSTHAVAVAKTERGEFVCDLLFGIVYERDDGTPISLKELQADPKELAAAIEREIQRGNRFAPKYPLEKYSYHAPRSVHWEHNPLLHGLYKVLAAVFGREWTDNLSVPHFMNEPAQVVAVGSLLAMITLWLPLGIRRLRNRPTGGDIASTPAAPTGNTSTPAA